jgi:CrcB protein
MSRTAGQRPRMRKVAVLVAVGGFAGANLRHIISLVVPGLGGTFTANVLGCLALGVLSYEAELVGVLSEETWYLAATGFLGSLTTYSTFALETVQAAPMLGVANVAANYAVGFAAVLVGRRIVRRVAEERE